MTSQKSAGTFLIFVISMSVSLHVVSASLLEELGSNGKPTAELIDANPCVVNWTDRLPDAARKPVDEEVLKVILQDASPSNDPFVWKTGLLMRITIGKRTVVFAVSNYGGRLREIESGKEYDVTGRGLAELKAFVKDTLNDVFIPSRETKKTQSTDD